MNIQDKIATGRELLQHARARGARFEKNKSAALKDRDYESAALAQSGIEQNDCFIKQLEADLESLEGGAK